MTGPTSCQRCGNPLPYGFHNLCPLCARYRADDEEMRRNPRGLTPGQEQAVDRLLAGESLPSDAIDAPFRVKEDDQP